jgi:membrane associated rhomboid family serine protease
MGAFLFRHARTKIRILSLLLIRPMILKVPAYLILGLWVVAELIGGLTSAKHASGVAHFAHLGGFAYGLAVAWALRLARLNPVASSGRLSSPWFPVQFTSILKSPLKSRAIVGIDRE